MNFGKTKRTQLVILSIPLALFLILISSFYIYPRFFQKKIARVPAETEQSAPASPDAFQGAIMPQATSPAADTREEMRRDGVNFEYCKNDPEEHYKREEATSPHHLLYATLLAIAKRDESVCAAIDSGKDADGVTCNDKYALMMAVTDGDCGKIRNKDIALLCDASQKNDVSLCAPGSDETGKKTCEASVSGSESGCDGLPGDQKGICMNNFFFGKALRSHDAGVCDKIDVSSQTGAVDDMYCRVVAGEDPQKEWNDIYVNSACYAKYAKSVAKNTNDASLCEKIWDKTNDNKVTYEECVAQFNR